MERLTKYSNDLIRNKAVNILRKLDSENGLDGDELAIISSFCLIERVENKQLKKYEDLEEQGKLLKLPCAVGNTVYTACSWGIESGIVGSIEIISDRIFVNNTRGQMIGEAKNIFLTREEAEAALKELERGKGE